MLPVLAFDVVIAGDDRLVNVAVVGIFTSNLASSDFDEHGVVGEDGFDEGVDGDRGVGVDLPIGPRAVLGTRPRGRYARGSCVY